MDVVTWGLVGVASLALLGAAALSYLIEVERDNR